MAEPEFFTPARSFRLDEIAELTGGTLLKGTPAGLEITGAAPLHVAKPGDLSFVAARKYLPQFKTTKAAACLTSETLARDLGQDKPLVIVPNPQLAYAIIAGLLFPEPTSNGQISPRASIAESARLGAGCQVDAGAVIADGVVIGEGSWIGPNAVVDRNVVLGSNCRIGANVTLSHCRIGNRVTMHPGAVIGQDGFGFVPGMTGLVKVPQLGRVLIDDDVEIGANTSIDRGAGSDTKIGTGTKIDNLVQIAHNCVIGKHCAFAGQVGLSGSVTVGDFVMLGGKVAVSDHVKIGSGAMIAGKSGVSKDVPPGEKQAGFPAQKAADWRREVVLLRRLNSKSRDG